jgi:hypothetical protein
MKARTVEELWREIASSLNGVSREECIAYLVPLVGRESFERADLCSEIFLTDLEIGIRCGE